MNAFRTIFGVSLAVTVTSVQAAVTLIEPTHTLTQLVDSAVPLHPSQAALDVACAFGNAGNIESIGIDPATGTLYVQLSPGGFVSADTCIFSITPGGVATLLNPSTGFGINSRGTDLHFDPSIGLLVTQDQNTAPDSIATVAPGGGAGRCARHILDKGRVRFLERHIWHGLLTGGG